MRNEFRLRIISPSMSYYDGACTSLVVPTTEGMYGIMANHMNVVAAITEGKLKYTDGNGAAHYAWVSEGLLKFENNEALVLVNTVEAGDTSTSE